MAKITLTFEDVGEGVKVTAEPTFETMMKMNMSGETITAAHGYALSAINHIRKISKDNERPSTIIKVPQLRRW